MTWCGVMVKPLAVLIALIAGACTGAPASPTGSISQLPTSTPMASPTPTISLSTVATASPPTPPTAAATSQTTGPGERTLLFTWYVTDTIKAAYLASRDGTEQRRVLVDVGGDIRAAKWSADGSRMAFVVRDAEHPDGAIWTASADGTGAAIFYDGLDAGCDSVFHPVWSPDGRAMSLICYDDSVREASLAVLDLDSMRLTRLVTYAWPEFLDNAARWSHDGRMLAFDVLRWDPTDTTLDGSRLATIAADGLSDAEYISDFDTFYCSVDWSPDDEALVFNSYDLGNIREATSNLYTSNVDGSNVEELMMAQAAGVDRLAQPRWDSDGTRIWTTVVDGTSFFIGWVDPANGQLNTLSLTGAAAEPQPASPR